MFLGARAAGSVTSWLVAAVLFFSGCDATEVAPGRGLAAAGGDGGGGGTGDLSWLRRVNESVARLKQIAAAADSELGSILKLHADLAGGRARKEKKDDKTPATSSTRKKKKKTKKKTKTQPASGDSAGSRESVAAVAAGKGDNSAATTQEDEHGESSEVVPPPHKKKKKKKKKKKTTKTQKTKLAGGVAAADSPGHHREAAVSLLNSKLRARTSGAASIAATSRLGGIRGGSGALRKGKQECSSCPGQRVFEHCTRTYMPEGSEAAAWAGGLDPADVPTEGVSLRCERNHGSSWLRNILMTNARTMWRYNLEPLRGSCTPVGVDGLLGWKHGALELDADVPAPPNVLVLVLVRDVFRWLASTYKKSYGSSVDKASSFSEFLRMPYSMRCSVMDKSIHPYYREYCDARGGVLERAPNIVDVRSQKYRSWLEFPAPKKAVLRYEDAYEDVEATFGKILDDYETPLAASAASFHHGASTAPRHRNMTVTEVLTEKVTFSAEDMLFINATLDWDLERRLHYTAYHEYFEAFERLHPGALAAAAADDTWRSY